MEILIEIKRLFYQITFFGNLKEVTACRSFDLGEDKLFYFFLKKWQAWEIWEVLDWIWWKQKFRKVFLINKKKLWNFLKKLWLRLFLTFSIKFKIFQKLQDQVFWSEQNKNFSRNLNKKVWKLKKALKLFLLNLYFLVNEFLN